MNELIWVGNTLYPRWFVIAVPAAVLFGTSLVLWLGIHFGGKLVDRMFYIPPRHDPNKPIVLPHAQDRDSSSADRK